jgi:hypothetical protein
MIALLVSAAWAADPAVAPWAGIPFADLAALGIGAPGLSATEPEWRALLGQSGLVRVRLEPDEAAAMEAFDGLRRTAASLWPADSPASVAGDQVAGDADHGLLVRDRNVVLFVADPEGRADEVVAALRSKLVVVPPAGTMVIDVAGQPVTVDAVGRPVR